MATYYVDGDNGNDSNNGLGPDSGAPTNKPWLTIGKALGATGISSADTVWIKRGIYRETVTLALTSPTAETKVLGDIHNQQGWSADPTHPYVEITAHTTNDTTAAAANPTITLAQRDYMTFEDLYIVGGDDFDIVAARSVAANQCTNLVFRRCLFIEGGSTNQGGNGIVWQSRTDGSPDAGNNLLVEECEFWNIRTGVRLEPGQSSTAEWNIGVTIRNCFFCGLDGADVDIVCANTTGTNVSSHGLSTNNTHFGGRDSYSLDIAAAEHSTTNKFVVENNVIEKSDGSAGAIEQNAAGSGEMFASDYNIIHCSVTHTNITAGSNDSLNTHSPRYAYGSSFLWNFPVKRHPGEPVASCPTIGHGGGTNQTTTDLFGNPRPGSGTQTDTIGAIENKDFGVQETTTTQTGSNAISWTGPGVHDFQLAVDAASTTVTIYGRYDSSYGAGTKPTFRVINGEEAGVTDSSDVMTAAANTWEQLSIGPFTPTSAGIITIRLESFSATAGEVFWDTFAVS